jgi:hypothetical protein
MVQCGPLSYLGSLRYYVLSQCSLVVNLGSAWVEGLYRNRNQYNFCLG